MSMPVRSMLIRKSIGRSDTHEPGAYSGVGLGACSAARSLGKEAVGADLADGAHDGPSSQRSSMFSWKRLNAVTSESGLGPSSVSVEATWTKLTPSSSWNVA